MRKITTNPYNSVQSTTATGYIRQNSNSNSQLNSYNHTYDDNHNSSLSIKKQIWNRSVSKDG